MIALIRSHKPFLLLTLLAASLPLLSGCESTLRSKYDQGYATGEGDQIKRNYWLRQELEQRTYTYGDGGRRAYYTLPGPTTAPDGTKLAPHPVTVPIDE